MGHEGKTIFSNMKDRTLSALFWSGKKNGARPFLRHPKVMMELRTEMEERGLSVAGHGELIYRENMVSRVLKKMGE